MSKRTAILGGSFNPIHNGHVALAKFILEENLADDVWLLISPQNPLKKNSELLNENVRLRLAQIALKNEEHIFASDFEFHLSRPSYTWNTLNALSEAYPDKEFLLTIGADNWLIFDQWAHYEDIIKTYQIVIYPRKGYIIDPKTLPKTVHFINAPLYPYSSTEIRKANQTLKKMLCKDVLSEYLKI